MLKKHNSDYWIPLADLMTGMMLIFLLIAVILVSQVTKKSREISTIKGSLYQELYQEFYLDLKKWHANLNESDLSIQFLQPEILFDTGDKKLKPQFKAILGDFFPRYLRIITQQKYLNKIKNLRIEGYASSEWNRATTLDEAYFLNMELSEQRARETFRYLYFLDQNMVATSKFDLQTYRNFLRLYVMVSGLSSSRVVIDKVGNENKDLSQRVEFKVGI